MAEKTKKPANPALISAVKAVAVLVCICFVCVALLAVCNELMYIDDEERLSRSLGKLFPDGSFSVDNSFNKTPVSEYSANAAYGGKINNVYKGTNGDYVLDSTGGGGYPQGGGKINLYVAISADAKIVSWTIKDKMDQSYADRVPASAGTSWYVGKDISNDLTLEITGATVQGTATAINNAVNMAGYYARNALGLGENPEAEAQKAVGELLGDEYASYDYTKVNLSDATVDGTKHVADALSSQTDVLSYLFLLTGSDNVFAYVYGVKETLKIVVVKEGEVIAKSDNVQDGDEIITNILANTIYTFTYGSYRAYAVVTNSEDNVYTVAGLKVGSIDPTTYVLKVTIEADPDAEGKGKVSKIEFFDDSSTEKVDGDGWVPGQGAPTQTDANKLATGLVGATLENIDTFYNDKVTGKATGATQSANLIRAAVEAALTAFDANNASAN